MMFGVHSFAHAVPIRQRDAKGLKFIAFLAEAEARQDLAMRMFANYW
jgi:hypothetical protein